MTEDDDISALRLAAPQARVIAICKSAEFFRIQIDPKTRDNHGRARGIGVPIRHLVHEKKIANQKRVFHRARRDPERLEKDRAKNPSDQERVNNGFDRFNDWIAFFFGFGHVLFSISQVHAT